MGAASVPAARGRTIAIGPVIVVAIHVRDVHVVRFPDAEALTAYRADPRLRDLAPVRERAIAHTEVLVGEDGPDYASAQGGPR